MWSVITTLASAWPWLLAFAGPSGADFLPGLLRPGSIGVRGDADRPRPPSIPRQVEPHGEGYVRLLIERKTFNDTADPKRTPERRRYRERRSFQGREGGGPRGPAGGGRPQGPWRGGPIVGNGRGGGSDGGHPGGPGRPGGGSWGGRPGGGGRGGGGPGGGRGPPGGSGRPGGGGGRPGGGGGRPGGGGGGGGGRGGGGGGGRGGGRPGGGGGGRGRGPRVEESLEVEKREVATASHGIQLRDDELHDIEKRWGWSNLTDFQGLAYLIDLKIGTPPQKVFVNVDTGSYELWVSPNCSNSDDERLCRRNGLYYPERSSSSILVGGTRHLVYGTGEALGTYWADTMYTAMMQIPQVQFMVASDSVYAYAGVLGLGYTYPWTTSYPYTLMQMMWAYGLIKAPIFSLGLGGEGDGHSEIIFGGVNVWKYTGRFEPVPIWPPIDQQDPGWLQYWVNVTSLGVTRPGENRTGTYTRRGFAMPMLVDSGSTLSYMREDLVAVIGQQFDARVDGQGVYWVDCAYRDMRGWVEFGFNNGNLVISVRYRDFIWRQYPGGCLLGVQPADQDSVDYVLGDTFLRAAYLVFDQQSDVVWMSRYYNCGDGVVVVGEKSADTQWAIGEC